MLLLIVSIIVFLVLNLLLGTARIPAGDVIDILFGAKSDNRIWTNIVMKSRLPQSLTAMMAGAGLGVSGLLMQTVFRNPLAGPSVLGISSGASLGVACVVLLSGSIGGVALSKLGVIGEVTITMSAIIGSLLIMALIAFVSQKVRGNVTLLIMGVMIGYIANAIIGVLKFFSAEEDIRAYVIWGLGSFSRVSGGQTWVFIVLMLIILPSAFFLIKPQYQTGEIARYRLFRNFGGCRHGLLRSYSIFGPSSSTYMSWSFPHIESCRDSSCVVTRRSLACSVMQLDCPFAGIRRSPSCQFRDGTRRRSGCYVGVV